MKRLSLMALLLAAVAGTHGQQKPTCYALWEAQCFEVHDASARKITHHILLTDGPVRVPVSADECRDAGSLLEKPARRALRTAFNDRIKRIDGCDALEKLEPRRAGQAAPLVERFQRLKEERPEREIHIIEPPETGA